MDPFCKGIAEKFLRRKECEMKKNKSILNGLKGFLNWTPIKKDKNEAGPADLIERPANPSPERKTEIMMSLAEQFLGTRRFPLGNDLLREAKIFAEKAGVTHGQALLFFKEIYVRLHNADFPEFPARNDNKPSNDLRMYGFEGGRDKVARAYIETEIMADLFLNKNRMNKALAGLAEQTKVGREELRLFLGELCLEIYQKKVHDFSNICE